MKPDKDPANIEESDFANLRVAAAVATLIVQNGKLLLGRRYKGDQFEGWQCPGGYLQKNESVEQAAFSICLEKAGLEISQLSPAPYTNNIFSDEAGVKHTVTLYVLARQYKIINNKVFDNKKDGWHWFDLDDLPSECFLPLEILMREHDLKHIISS